VPLPGIAFPKPLKSTTGNSDTKALARLVFTSEKAVGPVAIVEVCAKLRRRLSPVVGVVGFRSLLHRSLMITKTKADCFEKVSIGSDGLLLGLGDSEAPGNMTPIRDGGVILISNLLMLLDIFVGEALMISLLNEIWPVSRLKSAPSRAHTS